MTSHDSRPVSKTNSNTCEGLRSQHSWHSTVTPGRNCFTIFWTYIITKKTYRSMAVSPRSHAILIYWPYPHYWKILKVLFFQGSQCSNQIKSEDIRCSVHDLGLCLMMKSSAKWLAVGWHEFTKENSEKNEKNKWKKWTKSEKTRKVRVRFRSNSHCGNHRIFFGGPCPSQCIKLNQTESNWIKLNQTNQTGQKSSEIIDAESWNVSDDCLSLF